MSKDFVIVYHQKAAPSPKKPNGIDCPDGLCAAWVANRWVTQEHDANPAFFPEVYLDNEDYEKPEYKVPFESIGKNIVIVDFAYPESVLRKIAEEAESLVVLDHHETRGEHLLKLSLERLILGGYDINECGASYAWRHFFSEPPPWFIKYIRQRDMGADDYWEGCIPQSEAINEGISLMRSGLSGIEALRVFDELDRSPELEQKFASQYLPAIEERNVQIDAYLDEWERTPEYMDATGDRIPLFCLPDYLHRHYSTVGARGAKRFAPTGYVAVVCDDPTKVSLRSRTWGGQNVAIVAERMGGGGHRNASGFSLRK